MAKYEQSVAKFVKWILISFLGLISSIHPADNLLLNQSQGFNMKNNVYKVLTLDEWEIAETSGLIITELDQKDGFVHLSTASQLSATLALYFSQEDVIVLLQLDNSKIKDNLRYEEPIPAGNRKGVFPHYFGDLNINTISATWNLNRAAFEIPIEVILQGEQGPNA